MTWRCSLTDVSQATLCEDIQVIIDHFPSLIQFWLRTFLFLSRNAFISWSSISRPLNHMTGNSTVSSTDTTICWISNSFWLGIWGLFSIIFYELYVVCKSIFSLFNTCRQFKLWGFPVSIVCSLTTLCGSLTGQIWRLFWLRNHFDATCQSLLTVGVRYYPQVRFWNNARLSCLWISNLLVGFQPI